MADINGQKFARVAQEGSWNREPSHSSTNETQKDVTAVALTLSKVYMITLQENGEGFSLYLHNILPLVLVTYTILLGKNRTSHTFTDRWALQKKLSPKPLCHHRTEIKCWKLNMLYICTFRSGLFTWQLDNFSSPKRMCKIQLRFPEEQCCQWKKAAHRHFLQWNLLLRSHSHLCSITVLFFIRYVIRAQWLTGATFPSRVRDEE